MKDLLYKGSFGGIGILSILFLVIVIWSIYLLIMIIIRKDLQRLLLKINTIKSIGFFTFIMSILWQLIDFYQILAIVSKTKYASPDHISETENISLSFVTGGLKVTTIGIIYGLIIYIISILLWIALGLIIEHKLNSNS